MAVDYYADGAPGRSFVVQYDSSLPGGGPYTSTDPVQVPEESGWHTVTLRLPRAHFAGRQNLGSDFRITSTGTGDILIGDVRLSMDPQALALIFQAFDLDETRVVDRVEIGDPASERAHALRHEGSATGPHLGRVWRHAEQWMSWEMVVLPNEPMVLRVVYWGADVGRTFDVVVEGETVATQTLDGRWGPRFVAVDYPIPMRLTWGKNRATVKLAHREGLVGGVFGCAMLRGQP
jgi:hypothetical protein